MHRCPGQSLALGIAAGAIDSLLALGFAPREAVRSWSYRPSHNARIPEFRHPLVNPTTDLTTRSAP